MYQTIDAGSIFAGIGLMAMTLVMACFLYQLARIFKTSADKESKCGLLEEITIEKLAKKKGIDLEKETIKRSILKSRGKSFRKKLEEEMYDEMFGKEKE